MTAYHQELAAGRWRQQPFVDQMAHIGSEVERALAWRGRGNAASSQRAIERALELVDLSLAACPAPPRLRELARLRELLVDDFFGANAHRSTEDAWRRYFDQFAYAARRHL